MEFEQNGEDRAKYGETLLSELAKSLNIKGLSNTNLKLARQFYNTYPQIGQTVSDQLKQLGLIRKQIGQTPSDELQKFENQQLTF